jgi:hypothetical protein
MLAFQFIARQPVFELLLRRLPVNQAKVFAIVFQMAADAIFAIRIRHLKQRMVAMLFRQTLCHFLVATQALENGRAGPELMATRALRCSAQRLMRFRKWTGRNLCVRKSSSEKKDEKEKKKTPQPCRSTPFADVTSDSRLAEDQEVLRLSGSKQNCGLGCLKITRWAGMQVAKPGNVPNLKCRELVES